jgi:[ribosomal protein S5]-alanine N-acetyltransferase
MSQQALHTALLRMEPMQAHHAQAMFEVFSDPAIYRYLDERAPSDVDAVRQRLQRMEARRSPDGAEQWLNWAVMLLDAKHGAPQAIGRFIGHVQATVLADHRAWVAYVFHSAFWGQGHAAAAVSVLLPHLRQAYGVRQFLACVEHDHARSIHLLERFGFVAAPHDPAAASLSASERLYTLPGA